MLKKFPEIEQFFRKDYFSEEDLLQLKEKLASNYPEKNLLEKAHSLMELFLLKFKLSSPEELKNFKEEDIVNSHLKANKKITSVNVKQLDLPPGWSDERALDINCYKGVPLVFICTYLKISKPLIKRELSAARLDSYMGNSLSNEQFEALKPLLQKRILIKFAAKLGGGPLKLNKKITSIKRSNRRRKAGSYDEVAKYGLGKLIYIRSK
ncbi:hypothetical protein ACFQZJ_07040 [Maribacter chungangensis]|uniref:Uncharacterized protein n=1 Tax=Maribacter chungangensis TaxID=1069117 RepID=A0ABW3B1Q6_9FLAO